jgi:hypothetical protein
MKPSPLLLLVPLAWASFGFARAQPAAAPQPSSARVWQQSNETDAARSFNFTRYTLVGKFLSPPQAQMANRPALAVDCLPGTGSHANRGKFLAGNLLVGTALKIVYVEPEEIHGTSYYPKVLVRYRTDDSKDEEHKWSPGTEKTSASVPKESLKKILRARTLTITAPDDAGSQIDMRFDMPDAALVEAGCNVDEH